jgi:predicted dehydrogenase
MTTRRLGIIMNGITGRMGLNQHLKHAIMGICRDGGVALADGSHILPDPLLVGRDAEKLQRLAQELGLERWTTDLDTALAGANDTIYFDAVTTIQRAANLRKAIAAGKHVYTEKPIAESAADALELQRAAETAGICHGVVHDKLWAPGLLKLRMLRDAGFFGRILTVRIEGCYWVFEGDLQPLQRPSWNYRKEAAGGMILDMMPHYQYIIEDLFAPIEDLVCLGATHVPRRWDERGEPYEATADDAFYAILRLEGGVVAQIMSSWCVRVRRDDIIAVAVDGTEGSAVAGLRECRIQPRVATPRAQWSLDVADPVDFFADWQLVPDTQPYVNAFRAQWELFLGHVAEGAPFPWDLARGARGVQLAELALASWHDRRWVGASLRAAP